MKFDKKEKGLLHAALKLLKWLLGHPDKVPNWAANTLLGLKTNGEKVDALANKIDHPAGQFEKSCEYLSWHYFAGACFDAFTANHAKEQAAKEQGEEVIEAKADSWAWNSRLRKQVYESVLAFWCTRTGLDETWFPYSEDGVARMYFRFRKRQEEEREAFKKEIDNAA